MRPCRRVFARPPFRAALGVMILSVIGLLCTATTVCAQGPGLYKDGQKILDLEEMVSEDPGIAKTLAEPVTPARELYRQVLGDEAGTAQRPFDDYFRLAAACRQAVRYSKARPVELEKAVATLVDLEPTLATAHAGVIDHLEAVRRSLAAEPRLAGKISRLESLEREHLPLAEELLALLAALRDAEAGGHVFARDAALRDLALYFEADPIKAVEPEVDDGFRATSMPVVRPRENATPLTAGSLLSAYPVATAKSAMADPADLAPTIDVQITPEIVALADSLGRSPVAIYYFVRDQFEFEPYLGSRKGSQQTLQHRKGNDYDQASLLIALLRAAGIPARYAAGEAYMPMDRALNWLGFTSASGAASLLATAGMDPTWYPGGISCQRVWVEAYIPFANYRGAVNDSTGRMWIPLDPAFRQHDITWGHNLPADMGFDAETFIDQYMSTFRPETPVEHFIARLETELPNYYPGATLKDLVVSRKVILEPDGILPGTLPYELIAFDGTFPEIPSNMRYGIRFHVYGGGTDLDYTTTLPEIVLKQVTISYVGATPADQALIDAAGGVFGVTSPYLVDVVPVLKIDGCEVDRGTGQVMMGATHNSDMHFTVPTGASNVVPTVTNYITAGNYQGIGIDTQDAFPATFETPSTSCPEELLGQELHQTALTYLNNVDTYEDLAAGYLHMTVLNDVSEAIVENAVTVYFSGSLPVSFTWTGMIVDADRKIVGPFATDGRLDACQEMRLTGADGSFQENRVFETRFEEEAISAVKILSLAADSLITVCRITSSIAADCPGLSQPSSVVSAINAALAQGREVTIPERPFTYFDWSGTAWIAMDPATCAAGYIISGGQNGGATVQEWEIYYPQLACLYPAGAIDVHPAGAGQDPLFYSAESDERWIFTVHDLRCIGHADVDPPCAVLRSEDKQFTVTNFTIRQLAEDPRFGPGQYSFRVGGTGECASCTTIEKRVVILDVDATAHRPTTELSAYGSPFRRHEIPDQTEESPGAGIRVNGDSDSSTNENDLIEVSIKLSPYPLPGTAECILRRSNTNIKVWDKQTMDNALLSSGFEAPVTISSEQMTVWVECTDSGSADLDVIYRPVGGPDLIHDRIHFFPFTAVVVIFEGEFGVPSDPPASGVSRLALDLFENGYDVHLYDEPDIGESPNSETAAIAEIRGAIEDREVVNVALIGYSHGGGSVYRVSTQITHYTLVFSAYIDAITQPLLNVTAEDRRPVGSNFHVNYYQVAQGNDFPLYLDGTACTPAGQGYEDNVDDPQITESHTTIDDSVVVRTGITSRLSQRMAR